VESSEDAVIGKNLDGTITTWNSGAKRIYGYGAEEILGKHISILTPPERPDEVPQTMEKLRRVSEPNSTKRSGSPRMEGASMFR